MRSAWQPLFRAAAAISTPHPVPGSIVMAKAPPPAAAAAPGAVYTTNRNKEVPTMSFKGPQDLAGPARIVEPTALPFDQANQLGTLMTFYAPKSWAAHKDALDTFSRGAAFDAPLLYITNRGDIADFMLMGKTLLAMHLEPEFVALRPPDHPRSLEVYGRLHILPRIAWDGPIAPYLQRIGHTFSIPHLALWTRHRLDTQGRDITKYQVTVLNLPALPDIWRLPFGWFMGAASRLAVTWLPVKPFLDGKPINTWLEQYTK